MKQHYTPEAQQELAVLCNAVRKLVEQNEYQQAELLIKKAVGKYPGAPHPHNLLGLLLEARNDHLTAMKHFRAAWALDPTYLPARQNLNTFGSFYPSGKWAYDEADCSQEKKGDSCKIEYDANGVGHVVNTYKVENNMKGIGHVSRRTNHETI